MKHESFEIIQVEILKILALDNIDSIDKLEAVKNILMFFSEEHYEENKKILNKNLRKRC